MNVRLWGLIVCFTLAQLPIAMRPLQVTLLGVDRAGGFGVAGLAGGAAAAGMAVTAPWWARALSRFGDGRVLLVSSGFFLTAQVVLAIVHRPASFIAVAALSGLCTPPVSSSLRSMLPCLVAKEELTRVYTVNAVALEIVYIGGPLWVTGTIALTGAGPALVASTVTGVTATAFGAALAPREVPRARLGGPSLVTVAAVRTLGGSYLAYWVCMGAMWVLVPAFAEDAGSAGQAGLLIAVWSAGSFAGGLFFAARTPAAPVRASYLWLLTALAVTSLALTLPATIAAMAVAIAVFGLALAPWLAVSDRLAAAAAGERSGELYGWLTTVGQIGSAVGSALAGALGEHHGDGPAFLLVTAALVIGLAIAVCGRRTLPSIQRSRRN